MTFRPQRLEPSGWSRSASTLGRLDERFPEFDLDYERSIVGDDSVDEHSDAVLFLLLPVREVIGWMYGSNDDMASWEEPFQVFALGAESQWSYWYRYDELWRADKRMDLIADDLIVRITNGEIERAEREAAHWMGRKGASPPGPSRRISNDVVAEVMRRDEGRCVECGSVQDLQLDHIVPFSRGGSNEAPNLQLLCSTCNRRRGALR